MFDRNHLFVYGTLRSDIAHERSRYLGTHAKPIGRGWTHGILFQLNEFPGMVPDNTGIVVGEVYIIEDGRVWNALDDYEGEEFERREIAVNLNDGTTIAAFAYIYTGNTTALQQIESGDYLTVFNR